MKLSFKHYYVNEHLFIDYEDALDFCDKLNLSYSVITVCKPYKK